jgi:hypothetical protein
MSAKRFTPKFKQEAIRQILGIKFFDLDMGSSDLRDPVVGHTSRSSGFDCPDRADETIRTEYVPLVPRTHLDEVEDDALITVGP